MGSSQHPPVNTAHHAKSPKICLILSLLPHKEEADELLQLWLCPVLSRDPSQAALTLLILLLQCCPKQPLLRVEPTDSPGHLQRAQLPLLPKGSPKAHEESDTRFGPEPSPGHHKSLHVPVVSPAFPTITRGMEQANSKSGHNEV